MPKAERKTKGKLTHFDRSGNAVMVDVSAKPSSVRLAVARGSVFMHPETLALIEDRRVKKGDVLAVAQLAGITAAKRTPDMIPLCHPGFPLIGRRRSGLRQKGKRRAHYGDLQVNRSDGRRNGGAHGGIRGSADSLRHVQIGRPQHAPYQHPIDKKVRWKIWHLHAGIAPWPRP